MNLRLAVQSAFRLVAPTYVFQIRLLAVLKLASKRRRDQWSLAKHTSRSSTRNEANVVATVALSLQRVFKQNAKDWNVMATQPVVRFAL